MYAMKTYLLCLLLSGMVVGSVGCPNTDPAYCDRDQDCDAGALCEDNICVNTEVKVETGALPEAIAGADYNFTLQASGGIPPYKWECADAPAWLKCSES